MYEKYVLTLLEEAILNIEIFIFLKITINLIIDILILRI